MKRFVTETSVALVREVTPLLRARRGPDDTVVEERGPKEWHIVTAAPGPVCLVVARDPKIKNGSKALIVLELPNDDDDAD